ncbi:unnamed protein product [Acanthosepion pharaonis]|uniref:Uncharacterized protein n=1 Tax=Acanthosepion pharaonis TaxID=158019 RepID=A0A812E6Q9_ACAPH|nr:unnamed protein product [Sepia pharaonis]
MELRSVRYEPGQDIYGELGLPGRLVPLSALLVCQRRRINPIHPSVSRDDGVARCATSLDRIYGELGLPGRLVPPLGLASSVQRERINQYIRLSRVKMELRGALQAWTGYMENWAARTSGSPLSALLAVSKREDKPIHPSVSSDDGVARCAGPGRDIWRTRAARTSSSPSRPLLAVSKGEDKPIHPSVSPVKMELRRCATGLDGIYGTRGRAPSQRRSSSPSRPWVSSVQKRDKPIHPSVSRDDGVAGCADGLDGISMEN